MSSTQKSNEHATQAPSAGRVHTTCRHSGCPTFDRAKRSYGSFGWRLNADFALCSGHLLYALYCISGHYARPPPIVLDSVRQIAVHCF